MKSDAWRNWAKSFVEYVSDGAIVDLAIQNLIKNMDEYYRDMRDHPEETPE